MVPKYVGFFPKYVGCFSKYVGSFPKYVGLIFILFFIFIFDLSQRLVSRFHFPTAVSVRTHRAPSNQQGIAPASFLISGRTRHPSEET
jgi:hypothetical protein